MKTASETFIEHLTAVVKTGLTEVLATLVITSSRRASSPRVDAQQGPAQSHTFLLTCQAWCPTCKGIALITKLNQAKPPCLFSFQLVLWGAFFSQHGQKGRFVPPLAPGGAHCVSFSAVGYLGLLWGHSTAVIPSASLPVSSPTRLPRR